VDDAERGGEPPPPRLVRPAQPDSNGHSPGLDLATCSRARTFQGVPRQVSAARQFARSLLDGSSLRDDAVVVVSELFTNALLHTDSGRPGGLVLVQVSRWPLGVRVAVTDQGSASQPVVRRPGPHGQADTSGNGLYLVSRLSSQLEWREHASGRTVCAVLGKAPSGQRADQPGPSSPWPFPQPV
jgi:anti-sigma regulatory factor (Ser/Thr protein kinase)